MSIERVDFGHILRPASEAGTEHPRAEPVLGYLVRRPEGVLLFDTGIGRGDPETEAHYQPVRRSPALGRVDIIVNCHLHFDHCGGNPDFPGTPIYTQAGELARARAGQYTFDHLVAGGGYVELDGEAEIWPGVWVVPTPGHTPGHQSLVVREPGGVTVLAGQARDFASEFSTDWMARATGAGPYPQWLDRIAEFRPGRVCFAHDQAVWVREQVASLGS
ncbi:MBL fold metallo-hydrolase [Longispora albida]|uniref:MBL fold metallo-hydrolase n=1 Tax=Longispora albida TaxID=203523 RepID=UPI00036341BE|nr:MBL fold metallo-hydrolase [Longispora albida]